MAKKNDYFDHHFNNQFEAQRWALRAKINNLTKVVEKLEEAEKEHDFVFGDVENSEIDESLVQLIDRINAVIATNEEEIMELDNEIKTGGK